MTGSVTKLRLNDCLISLVQECRLEIQFATHGIEIRFWCYIEVAGIVSNVAWSLVGVLDQERSLEVDVLGHEV